MLIVDRGADGRLRQLRASHRHRSLQGYRGPLWKTDWFVYAKRPFAGPSRLAYLSRYTQRVAISNSRSLNAVGAKNW
jgi:hypothetical protein